MNKTYTFLFSLALLLLGQVIHAQKVNFELVNEFQNLEEIKNASWGLKLVNLNSKEVIVDLNSHTSLIPASTLKLFSSGMALNTLGPDYTFKTIIAINGEKRQGQLHGDLIIKGGGDPTFGNEAYYDTAVIQTIIETLRKNDIHKIEGNLIVDLSHYPKDLTPHTWVYQDMGNYYGASPSALTYKNNTFKIYFSRENKENGKTQILDKSTEGQDLILENHVTTGAFGSGDGAYVYGAPEVNKYIVRGTIPPGENEFYIKASMSSSSEYFLYELKMALKESEIEFDGENRIEYLADSDHKIIDSIISPKLLEIITEVNVNSNNLYAEHVYVETQTKRNGNINDGMTKNFFTEYGLNSEGLYMEDGSGLSRYNSVTIDNQIDFLEFMFHSDNFDSFLNSMAEGGKSGTIKDMFQNTKSIYRLKSGTLSRVKAYTGYVLNQKGDTLAISFIVNNYAGSSIVMKKKMEDLIKGLCE